MQLNKSFKFGVEIETVVPDGVDYRAIAENLNVDYKGDGSIESGYEDGVEFVTKPLGYNAMTRTITTLCNELQRQEVKVNRSCGLHIHASNKRFFSVRYLRHLTNTWIAIEDVLYLTQPSSRLGNSYCKRLLSKYVHNDMFNAKEAKNIIGCADDWDRYTALNFNALEKHGTLEVRLFAGTVSAEKIKAYLELVRAIYSWVMTEYDEATVKDLFKSTLKDGKSDKVFKLLKLTAKTVKVLETRINDFKRYVEDLLVEQQEKAVKFEAVADKVRKAKEAYERASNAYRETSDETRGLQF
jgi:hypothetical protein